MINILDFSARHIPEAEKLALMNYNEERAVITELPQIDKLPDLTPFSENGLGVAAFDGDKMLGFLCCHTPWNNAFKTPARGTFSPIHAHGVIKENRGKIYKALYQSAAEKWVKRKVASHAIALYAHDSEAIDAMFSYGFGLRSIDAIMPMENIDSKPNEAIFFCELHKSEVFKIRELRRLLSEHTGNSPCFMFSTQDEILNSTAREEEEYSRVFAAKNGEEYIAFVKICDNAETFGSDIPEMLNICGAYCLPQFRGSGVFQSLHQKRSSPY